MEASQTRILHRADADIAWSSTGSPTAPALVCVHGGGMDRRMWDPQNSLSSGRFRMITLDVRGHGDSRCAGCDFSLQAAADDMVSVMEAADVETAVFIGHSFGATIAQLVALRSPERVRALAGIGATCATLPSTAVAKARRAMNPLALRVLGPSRVRAMFADMAGVRPEVKEYAAHALSKVPDDVFAAVMRTGFGDAVTVEPGYRLGVPLMLILGDREPYRALLGKTDEWIRRDQGTLVTVPNAAHNANQDAPDAVNRALQAFLNGLA